MHFEFANVNICITIPILSTVLIQSTATQHVTQIISHQIAFGIIKYLASNFPVNDMVIKNHLLELYGK